MLCVNVTNAPDLFQVAQDWKECEAYRLTHRRNLHRQFLVQVGFRSPSVKNKSIGSLKKQKKSQRFNMKRHPNLINLCRFCAVSKT